MATAPTRGPVTRWFEAWIRSWTYYQAGRRPRRPVTSLFEQPEPDERIERAMRTVGWVLALGAPLVVCTALVALRSDIDRSTATLVLVLPVVLVAVIGGPGPAALAAAVAPLAFDVLLTRPYYRPQIHAVEDVEATLILLTVGFLVGQVVARETRSRVQSSARRTEVKSLLAMISAASRPAGEKELTEQAVAALTELLELRECRWSPGYHGAAHPRVTPEGEIAGDDSRTRDRAPLPGSGVELPVMAGSHELGRLILAPAGPAPVSREERLVAVAIADVFGLGLAGTGRP